MGNVLGTTLDSKALADLVYDLGVVTGPEMAAHLKEILARFKIPIVLAFSPRFYREEFTSNLLRGMSFAATVELVGDATHNSVLQIKNPASSNKNLLVQSAHGDDGVSGSEHVLYSGADFALWATTTINNLFAGQDGQQATVAELRAGVGAAGSLGLPAASATIRYIWKQYYAAGGSPSVLPRALAVIPPGFSYNVWAHAVNTTLRASVQWAELPLEGTSPEPFTGALGYARAR